MEEPGYNSDRVYVLRQAFQPNEPLREAFSDLLSTSHQGARHFSIYGGDQRVVSLAESRSQEFDMQLHEADAFLAKRTNSHLLLEGEIKGRLVRAQAAGAWALQLLMKAEYSSDYTYIRSALDLIRMGERTGTPNLEGASMFMSIPYGKLRPLKEVKGRLGELNQALGTASTRRLYGVIPSTNLIGRPALRMTRGSEGDEYPEIRAS